MSAPLSLPEAAQQAGLSRDASMLLPPPEQNSEPHEFTEKELGEYREQDRFLPIANVSRIMKNSVPSNAKISKDAKEIVQECVSEFISFITSEAAEKCVLEKRKTVGGEDLIYAMSSLGFGDYAMVMRIYLAKLREQNSAASAARHQGFSHSTQDMLNAIEQRAVGSHSRLPVGSRPQGSAGSVEDDDEDPEGFLDDTYEDEEE